MAGFSKIFVVGGLGGFMGADGVNPIEFMILVGDADRQWLEPHYFNRSLRPIGQLKSLVPPGPNEPDAALDACIAFCPQYFPDAASLKSMETRLRDFKSLDLNQCDESTKTAWFQLREECRPAFASLNVWQAELQFVEDR